MHTIQIHLTNSWTNQNKPKPNCRSENKQHDFHPHQRKEEIKWVLMASFSCLTKLGYLH